MVLPTRSALQIEQSLTLVIEEAANPTVECLFWIEDGVQKIND